MDLSLRAAAAEQPQQLAILSDGVQVTNGELWQRVAQACAELKAQGLTSNSRVAISARNRLETVVSLLALIELGIPFVPLHPRWTEREVAVVLADARPMRVLRDEDLDGLGTQRRKIDLHNLDYGSVDARATLAILYTSGTTGTPKGAVLSRAAFMASAAGSAASLGWHAEDRWLLCLPLCHIGGLSIVTRCLLARRPIVLLPRFDVDAVLAAIDRDRTTLISVVPTMLRALLDAEGGPLMRRLRAVISGGAATPFSLLEQAVAQGVNVLTTYGLTEACSQVTLQKWQAQPQARRGSGAPLDGVQLLLRGDDDAPLGPGEAGRICVRGPTLMDGYLHRAPLGDGFFDTGDLGELDERGVLHVHARRTELIVTGGENVYPAEVEQVLMEVPGIRRALVFGVPDAK